VGERSTLTNRYVGSLVCPPNRAGVRIMDAKVPGLGVYVASSGTKVWRYRYRVPGKTAAQEMTLGRFPDMSYEDAKRKVGDHEGERKSGRNPRAEIERAKAVAATTLSVVLDHYLDRLVNERTRYNASKAFKDVRARFGDHPVAEVTAHKLLRFYEENYSHRPGGCRTSVGYLKAAFEKALVPSSGLALPPGFVNPATGLKSEITFTIDGKRKRLASMPKGSYARSFAEGDLRRMFDAIDRAYAVTAFGANPMGIAVIELCLLTGMRPDESCSLRWDEIKVDEETGLNYVWKADHKTKEKGKLRKVIFFGEVERVFERARAWRKERRYDGPYVFPVRKQRHDMKHGYVTTTTIFANRVSAFTVEPGRTPNPDSPDPLDRPIEFVPYNLRSGFINWALDTVGEEHIAIVAENSGHTIETCRRYYRRHREERKADVFAKVDASLARLRQAA
jgi:integrase